MADTLNKKRVVKNLGSLSPELLDALKKKYPYGWTDSMIRIDKGPGDFFYAVVLETDDTNYLIKVDVKIDGQLDEEEDKDYYDDDEIKGADDIADADDEEPERNNDDD